MSIEIEIAERTFDLPEDWSEITFSKFLDIDRFVHSEMPGWIKKIQFEGDEKIKDEMDLLNWYRNYVSFVGGIPEKISKKIIVQSEGVYWGLLELYGHLSRFMYMPPKWKNIQSSFKFKGKVYHCFDDAINCIGEKQPLKGATFEEYEAISTIIQSFNDLKEGKFKNLALLTAIIFRPKGEDFDNEKIKKRAEVFHGLTMDKIFSAYFFLYQQKKRLLRRSVRSLKSKARERGIKKTEG